MPSAVVEASTNVDVEKGICVMENQQRGTAHVHHFTIGSVSSLNPSGGYGAYDDHVNYQRVRQSYCISVPRMLIMYVKYISCNMATNLYCDDLSNDSNSSMPSLEWPVGSTPLASSDVCLPYHLLMPT
jgi:hypothetical protein